MYAAVPVKMNLDRLSVVENVDVMQGDSYTRAVEFHLFFGKAAWFPPDDASAMIHFSKPDGSTGSYDILPNGDSAYTIKGNTLTVHLIPEVCTVAGTVHLVVDLIQGENRSSLFCTHIRVYANPASIDRNEVCDPCVTTRIIAQADGQSTMSVTVLGIYEGLVTDIFLEYVLRPTKDNEPVLIPIEAGDYDLVNGHIYSTSIPIVSNFRYRGVIHYVDTDGNARVYEECWNEQSDTMRGFWGFSQEET